jgi:hypothetical protein
VRAAYETKIRNVGAVRQRIAVAGDHSTVRRIAVEIVAIAPECREPLENAVAHIRSSDVK